MSDSQQTLASQLKPLPDTLSGWLNLLESLHPTEIDMGLERTQHVFDALRLDFSTATVITVAGTNGKGSTCRFIEKLAQKLGFTTGVYSSPHITDYKERVRINDQLLSDSEHCQAFEKVFAARGDTSLTYFESGTLAALQLLAEYKPDIIILEVGLGGRLDAVNVVEPDVSVITSIGIDHQAWLGDTRELIAIEKAGIARSDKPCVVGEPDSPNTLWETLCGTGAQIIKVGRDFFVRHKPNSWDYEYRAGQQSISWQGLPLGNLLQQNIGTALSVACYLGWNITQEHLRQLIPSVTLPGRYETVSQEPRVILDVAHNQQATRVLANRIQHEDRKNLYIVAGMLSDKDSMASLKEFEQLNARWFVAPLDTPRSAQVEVLNSALPFARNVTNCSSVADAYQRVMQEASESDVILVFGSFYTVAEFKQVIRK